MGAPEGNQYAVGLGRPYKTFSNDELKLLGEELLDWCKEKENDKKIVHLSQWYSHVKCISRTEWNAMRNRESFIHYYERAIEWMGTKTLTNKNISDSYGNRFLNIYFKDIRENEREAVEHKIDYEIKKKKEVDLSHSYPNDQINDAQLAWIKAQAIIEELQAQNKELKEKILAAQPKAD